MKAGTLAIGEDDNDGREIDMARLGEMTPEDAAHEAAGNWQRFPCFRWDRERDLERPGDWAIINTHKRGGGLLDRSNAEVIARTLGPYTKGDDPDAVPECHDHRGIGHVDGFSIRVYRDSEITDAFWAYHGLARRLADHPALDEADHSRREYEATIENIGRAGWRLKVEFDLPDGWEAGVFRWLRDHRREAIKDRDDRGGYPDEAELRVAVEALGYGRLD